MQNVFSSALLYLVSKHFFFIVVSVSPPKIDIGDQCWDECYLTALPVTDHSGDPQQENAFVDYLLSVEGMNLLKREKNRQI